MSNGGDADVAGGIDASVNAGLMGGGYGSGDPNAGGGPLVGDVRRHRIVRSVPVVKPQPQGFQIDPNQVLNDIALGSGWGTAPTAPQMNPFGMYGGAMSPLSMYGSPAGPFNWGAYYNTFGGK